LKLDWKWQEIIGNMRIEVEMGLEMAGNDRKYEEISGNETENGGK